MKRTIACLNSVKSRCFVLLACLSLFVSTTSCNDDEFETVALEGRGQYTKAELIEQALSRMPRTRANGSRDLIVKMVTIKDTVSIGCSVNDTVTIDWDGEEVTKAIKGQKEPQVWTFTNGNPSHYITLVGNEESLNSLSVDGCGLISLEIYSNPNLTTLGCGNNHLGELDLTGCLNLGYVNVSDNELSFLDVSYLDKLESFDASNNRLKNIVFNEHPYMYELFVENNQLTDLDLSGITDLYSLTAQNNPLKSLNVKECLYLYFLNISSTSLSNIDLSRNTEMLVLLMENTSVKVFNNRPFDDMSFAVFEQLGRLSVANTPFTSLNFSNNPRLYSLDISGSMVSQLNLSNTIVGLLYATRSQLTDLICEQVHLDYLFEVRIESTPLEKDVDKMKKLGELLPLRPDTSPGHLYTYSLHLNDPLLLGYIKPKNWLINR